MNKVENLHFSRQLHQWRIIFIAFRIIAGIIILKQTIQMIQIRVNVSYQLIQRQCFQLAHGKHSIVQSGAGARAEGRVFQQRQHIQRHQSQIHRCHQLAARLRQILCHTERTKYIATGIDKSVPCVRYARRYRTIDGHFRYQSNNRLCIGRVNDIGEAVGYWQAQRVHTNASFALAAGVEQSGLEANRFAIVQIFFVRDLHAKASVRIDIWQ